MSLHMLLDPRGLHKLCGKCNERVVKVCTYCWKHVVCTSWCCGSGWYGCTVGSAQAGGVTKSAQACGAEVEDMGVRCGSGSGGWPVVSVKGGRRRVVQGREGRRATMDEARVGELVGVGIGELVSPGVGEPVGAGIGELVGLGFATAPAVWFRSVCRRRRSRSQHRSSNPCTP